MRNLYDTTNAAVHRFAGVALRVLVAVCCCAAIVRSSRAQSWIGAEFWIGAASSSFNPALPTRYPPGSRIVFSGGFPAPSGEFQWYHDGLAIPSATEWTYTIAAATSADTGNYQLVWNSGGRLQKSHTATINILPEPPSNIDPTFTAAFDDWAVRPYVLGIAADGSLLVWAESWRDTTFKIVRLFADGAVDPTFSYSTFSGGSPLAVLPNGDFITNRGPHHFNRDGSSNPLPLPSDFFDSSSGFLTAAAVYPDGSFLAVTDNNLARFAPDGTLDPKFQYIRPGSGPLLIGHLELDSAGQIYVTAGTKKDSSGWRADLRVFRLLSSGAFDSTFAVQQLGADSTENSDFIQVHPFPSGRLLRFDYINGVATFSFLNNDGSPASNWSAKLEGHAKYLVDSKNERVYAVENALEVTHAYDFTATGLVEDPGFHIGVQSVQDLTLSAQGDALYLGSYGLKRVKLPTTGTPPIRISITLSPSSPEHADANTLLASIDSDQLQYEWLALDGQPLSADRHSAELRVPTVGPANRGRYQLRVTGPTGVALLSNVVDLDAGEPVTLANLSGRAVPGTGENTVIAGFTAYDFLKRVPGDDNSLSLLIRGVGPALKSMGVSNYLPNPALTLYDRSGNVVGNNDNWGTNTDRDAIREDAAITGAFALPEDGLDASLLKSCYNQQFTAQLSDQTGQSGVGLLEIYRVPKAYTLGELTNLSLRANTGSGERTAIAGFVLTDPQNLHRSARVLLRVIGPTLASYGITHPLADPILTLFNSKGEVIRRVDNWGDDQDVATLTATMKQVGAFELPASSKDAAIVLDLPAGVYTMHATGGEGVVLLEIYLVR